MNLVTLSSDRLNATISPLGAELQSLTLVDGTALIWDGDPAWWAGRSPILFPVIGMLNGGVYRWEGKTYPLDKHGFARRSGFELVEHGGVSATLRLTADDATRMVYPFEFGLDLRYTLGDDLGIAATVSNHGSGPMPFSFGFHPALRLADDGDASLTFAAIEAGPVWRMNGDGLLDRSEPLTRDWRTFPINADLFRADAMILRDVASRSAILRSGGRSVAIAWDNLSDLALWQKPGAPFLCVEPWAGYNDPAGFDGSITDKPGIVMLAPGERWTASMTIRPL